MPKRLSKLSVRLTFHESSSTHLPCASLRLTCHVLHLDTPPVLELPILNCPQLLQLPSEHSATEAAAPLPHGSSLSFPFPHGSSLLRLALLSYDSLSIEATLALICLAFTCTHPSEVTLALPQSPSTPEPFAPIELQLQACHEHLHSRLPPSSFHRATLASRVRTCFHQVRGSSSPRG